MQFMALTRRFESNTQKAVHIVKRIIMKSKGDRQGNNGVCAYRHLLLCNPTRLTKTDYQMWRKCTTSEASFLAPSTDDRVNPHSGSSSHVAGANSIGAVDLMRRN